MTTGDKQQETVEKEPIKVSFSLPQIAGGALAAATAALIGSRLGVGGTVFGAAVASIVGGVGGTLYSAGIDRTHRKVTDAIQRGYERVRKADDYDPDASQGLDAAAGQARALAPGAEPDVMDTIFRPAGRATRADLPPVSAAPTVPGSGRRGRFWQVTALTVGAIFLVALAVITAVELGLGQPLGGGKGTTVSQVVKSEPSASAKPTRTPTPSATTVTPTPTATVTPTPTPSATPTPTVTGTPSEAPTGAAEATPAATQATP